MAEKTNAMSKEDRSKLKAVIPVHLYGQCADMEPILKIAEELDSIVVEDAAQAIGAEYRFDDGRVKRAGSMGDYGCFSFYPTKNLGGFGEGGMVTTNDEEIYEKLIAYRHHGDIGRYNHEFVGGNFRLDAIQAALLLVKFSYLDEWNEKRIKNANYYKDLFKEADIKDITLPHKKEKRHIYNQFVIKVKDRRDGLEKYLKDHEIGCAVYYPVPLHIQTCFKSLGYKPQDFPISMDAAKNTLALPIYPEVTPEQIRYVVDITNKFFKMS
jgi:dTDP-4-amino-4,6-dideoxygalactose transaminase